MYIPVPIFKYPKESKDRKFSPTFDKIIPNMQEFHLQDITSNSSEPLALNETEKIDDNKNGTFSDNTSESEQVLAFAWGVFFDLHALEYIAYVFSETALMGPIKCAGDTLDTFYAQHLSQRIPENIDIYN